MQNTPFFSTKGIAWVFAEAIGAQVLLLFQNQFPAMRFFLCPGNSV